MKLSPLLFATLIAGCAPAADSQAQTPAAPQPAVGGAILDLAGAPRLSFPLACRIGETCALQNLVDRDPGPGAKDYRCGRHTYQAHGGVDIRLPDMAAQRAGVEVLAAAPGRVSRLRDGVTDVSVRAAGAPGVKGAECGNGVVIDHGGGWETQYCHMARGSLRVKPGDAVTTGQPLGRVGLSGNTEYPHLHLTVRHGTTTVDPFAPAGPPEACDPGADSAGGLWDRAAAQGLAYRRGVVLNAGFAAGPTPMEVVEAGGIAPPSAGSPALVAYVRTLNLEAGDVQGLVVRRPDGSILSETTVAPLDGAKAQYVLYAGKRAPAEGWPKGRYTATYWVRRNGAVALQETFAIGI